MEDYCNYYRRPSHQVPAFGSWDWNNDLPFTQCFETARQAGTFLRYSYSEEDHTDLYVAGDLYQNDVVTPTIIAVPRNTKRNTHEQQHVKGDGKQESWVVISGNGDVKATLSPINHQFPIPIPIRQTPKPVDEDLYKLDSPDLLYAKRKKKGVMGFISNCLLPSCVL
ncbi:hypothetical protein ACFE04_001414 [Oxalis oulophora]